MMRLWSYPEFRAHRISHGLHKGSRRDIRDDYQLLQSGELGGADCGESRFGRQDQAPSFGHTDFIIPIGHPDRDTEQFDSTSLECRGRHVAESVNEGVIGIQIVLKATRVN